MALRYKYDSVADMPSLDNSVDPVQVVNAHNQSSSAHEELFQGVATAGNITSAVNAHNTSGSAHTALFEGKADADHTHTAGQITGGLMVRTASVPDEETALEQSAANPNLVYWWEESD